MSTGTDDDGGLRTRTTRSTGGRPADGPVPSFSLSERDRRWTLAREFMSDRGLDALVVYGDREGAFPAPFAPDTWFTNDRPGAIVIAPREGEPVAITALPMAIADQVQARLRDERIWIEPDHVFAGKKGVAVVEALKHLGLADGTVGVVGLEPYPPFYFDGPMPYNTWKAVLDGLPGAEFRPVQGSFLARVAERSEEELAVLRRSAAIGEEMCEAMLAAARPGVTEGEIYAAAMEVAPREAGWSGFMILGSGPEYFSWGPPTWLYRPHAQRRIEDGDIVLAEVFCSVGMLETQHQPTIAVGAVHEDVERAGRVARTSYEAGLEALRPGVTFGSVARAMEEPVRAAGGSHVHPWLHGMDPFGTISGFEGSPDLPGIDRYGRVGQVPLVGDDVVLRPGMVFAFEPNCAFGGHVVNLGGTVVVGDDGPIELNRVATRLMHA
jgi:Xaa-Pro aminopeptidase